MPLTKSQSAAPRSARQEARSFTYDKGQTLLHDVIARPENLQSKGHKSQTVRNSQGLMFNRVIDRAVAISRRGFECRTSDAFAINNSDQAQLVSNTNALKSTLAMRVTINHESSAKPMQNQLRINTNVSIIVGNVLACSLDLSNNVPGSLFPNLFDFSSRTSVSGTNIIVKGSTNNTIRNSATFLITDKFSISNDGEYSVWAYGPPTKIPYPLNVGIADVSADKITRVRDHFRISMRPWSTSIRGAIVRSGISWQQAKNDQSFLRKLKWLSNDTF